MNAKKSKNQKILKARPVDAAINADPMQRIVDFLQDHGSSVIYAFLGIGVVLASLYLLTRSSENNQFIDYRRAEGVYQQFVQGGDLQLLEKLEELMARHPDLKQKYEGKIAQELIAMNEIELAAPYVEELLNRSQEENFPLFFDYTKTTQIINQGKYDEAYSSAQDLQAKLKEVDDYHQLYAYNLLRLAMLEQKLKLHQQELARWEEILSQAEKNGAVMAMVRHLHEGHVNLKTYIDHRISELQDNHGSGTSSFSHN